MKNIQEKINVGSIYEGNWENNKQNGIGKKYNINPRYKYIGNFKDNKMHGYGELTIDFNEYSTKINGKFNNDKFFGKYVVFINY